MSFVSSSSVLGGTAVFVNRFTYLMFLHGVCVGGGRERTDYHCVQTFESTMDHVHLPPPKNVFAFLRTEIVTDAYSDEKLNVHGRLQLQCLLGHPSQEVQQTFLTTFGPNIPSVIMQFVYYDLPSKVVPDLVKLSFNNECIGRGLVMWLVQCGAFRLNYLFQGLQIVYHR